MGLLDDAVIRLCFLCAGAALVTFFITGVAARAGVMGDAVNHRSNHQGRPSRAGGVIIFLLTGGLTLMAVMAGAPWPPVLVTMAICAAALGGIDDVSTLPATPKLIVLGFISILTVVMVGPLPPVPLPFVGDLQLPAFVTYPLAVLFLLAFVNAFNFMDGLNGLSGSVAIVALSVLLLNSGGANLGFAFVVLLLASVLYGFVVRNVMTGKIFLGDAGSLGLGLFLAAAALWQGQGASGLTSSAFYVFVIAFIPYLADTGVTLIRRWRAGKPLLQAHKEHFYQQMRALGWSHQAVAAVYAGLTFLGGVLAWLAQREMGAAGLWAAGLAALAFYGLTVRWMVCGRYERRTTERLAKSSSSDRSGAGDMTDSALAASSA